MHHILIAFKMCGGLNTTMLAMTMVMFPVSLYKYL